MRRPLVYEDISPSRGSRTEANCSKESPIAKEHNWLVIYLMEKYVEAAFGNVHVFLGRSGKHTDKVGCCLSVTEHEVGPWLGAVGDEVLLGFSEIVCWLLALLEE